MAEDIATGGGEPDCRVLILDPLGEIPSSLKFFLDFGGYQTVYAEGLEGAQGAFGTMPPEIVFSGARFCWSGGIDSVKGLWPGAFCVFVSAGQRCAAELETFYLGAEGFLDLPITLAKLDAILGVYWEKRRIFGPRTGAMAIPLSNPSNRGGFKSKIFDFLACLKLPGVFRRKEPK